MSTIIMSDPNKSNEDFEASGWIMMVIGDHQFVLLARVIQSLIER